MFNIDKFKNDMPIYQQVIFDIKSQIASNELKAGDKLPSSREMAVKYSINPNTASRVYREMELEGLCFTKRGLGTYVTEDTDVIKDIKKSLAETLIDDFVQPMKAIGYTKEEMIELIREKEID